jgi:hypothetical protein
MINFNNYSKQQLIEMKKNLEIALDKQDINSKILKDPQLKSFVKQYKELDKKIDKFKIIKLPIEIEVNLEEDNLFCHVVNGFPFTSDENFHISIKSQEEVGKFFIKAFKEDIQKLKNTFLALNKKYPDRIERFLKEELNIFLRDKDEVLPCENCENWDCNGDCDNCMYCGEDCDGDCEEYEEEDE